MGRQELYCTALPILYCTYCAVLYCMGRQEQYFFNLEDFFQPHHPGTLSSMPVDNPLRFLSCLT